MRYESTGEVRVPRYGELYLSTVVWPDICKIVTKARMIPWEGLELEPPEVIMRAVDETIIGATKETK